MKRLLAAALIAITALGAQGCAVHATTAVAPAARHWVPGHWEGAGRARHWVPGHWVGAARLHWVPGHWEGAGRARHWVPGHWAR